PCDGEIQMPDALLIALEATGRVGAARGGVAITGRGAIQIRRSGALRGKQGGGVEREYDAMRLLPLSIGLGVALAIAPISAASAHEFYHHHHYGLVGGIFGLAGAVVVGAVTIVTAPIVILAHAISGPRYERREGYDQGYGGYE